MKYQCGLPPKIRGHKYYQYLASEKWKKKATKYKTKFPICESCRKNKSEHVHHQTYSATRKERYWDLLALCANCHRDKHNLN